MTFKKHYLKGLVSVVLIAIGPSTFASSYSLMDLNEALEIDYNFTASNKSDLLFQEAPLDFTLNRNEGTNLMVAHRGLNGWSLDGLKVGTSAAIGLTYPNTYWLLFIEKYKKVYQQKSRFIQFQNELFFVLDLDMRLFELTADINFLRNFSFYLNKSNWNKTHRVSLSSEFDLESAQNLLTFPALDATIEDQTGKYSRIPGQLFVKRYSNQVPDFGKGRVFERDTGWSRISSRMLDAQVDGSGARSSYNDLFELWIRLPNDLRSAKLAVEHIFNMSKERKSFEKTIINLATPSEDYACKKALSRK